MARIDKMSFARTAPKGSAQIVIGETTVALPLAGVIDMAAERTRLERELDKIEGEIGKIDSKLGNAQFVAKAPPEVVEENRERRIAFEATARKLRAALQRVRSRPVGVMPGAWPGIHPTRAPEQVAKVDARNFRRCRQAPQ